MIKACIFDMDGTIADTLASIAGFSNDALAACGYPSIPVEKYRTLVGNGADKLIRRMLTCVAESFTEEEVKRVRAIYDEMYASDPMKLVTEYPGMRDTLCSMKEKKILLGVFSNKPDDMTQKIAEMLYPGLFHAVRGQRKDTPLKPAPDGALLLAENFRVSPSECLYIGDTWVDMETGKNAGMETVGVLWGFREKEELEKAGAKHIIADPNELLFLAGLA